MSTSPNWALANCVGADPELFFPKNGLDQPYIQKIFCDPCPIQQECALYAEENHEWGLWGYSRAYRLKLGKIMRSNPSSRIASLKVQQEPLPTVLEAIASLQQKE